MNETTNEIVTFVHEWSIDRISELWYESDKDHERKFDAMAIYDEFAEWTAEDPDKRDQIEVLSIKSFS